jgi:hypothetical protein
VRWLVAAAALVILTGRADAYPQFQLSRDAKTCTECHLSPAGGEFLNENGTSVAENISQFGTSPEFMYGAVSLPKWLLLGGDFRSNMGYNHAPQNTLAFFPMQADVYGRATYEGFTLHVNVGYRPAQYGNEARTRIWSREHYLQWQQDPGANYGLYVRVGRLMPVFGLRLAEHPDYIRRYGGTQLYSEKYAAAISYVQEGWETHFTAFTKADPIIDTVEHASGVAEYSEVRPIAHAAVGGEAMYKQTDTSKELRVGAVGKYYVAPADVLLQGEYQHVLQWIQNSPGYHASQVMYLLASWFVAQGFMLDVGLGYYNENPRIRYLDRECVDVNFHWFATSHIEAILNLRYEEIGLGKGGPYGDWALLQLHYRL